MKAIILAAGYATRLYPLTQNFPKPLLEVGSKTILDWLIDGLEGTVDEFAVVTNHRFADHFARWAQGRPVRIIDDGTTTNETRLGAVKDIRLAARTMEGEDVLVMAGDNVLTFPLSEFVRFAQNKGTSCVMCHKEPDLVKQRKTGIITVDEQDRITSYEEKPENPKGDLAVPPFYYYLAQDVARIGEGLEDGCGYDAPGSFAVWLSQKVPMHAWRMPGPRYDIGDIKSYEYVKSVFDKK